MVLITFSGAVIAARPVAIPVPAHVVHTCNMLGTERALKLDSFPHQSPHISSIV